MIGPNTVRIQVNEQQFIFILRLVLLVLSLVPWLILGITILVSPGHIMPFINDPRGGTSLLLFCLWEAVGIGLFVNTTRKGLNPFIFHRLITTIIVFVFPLFALYGFGPIALKIIDNSGSHRRIHVVAPNLHHGETETPEKSGL